jgi:type IV secretion system protein VirB10
MSKNDLEQGKQEEITGERTITSVTKSQSVQSKVNNFLGIAVIILLGGGFLYWYYSNAFGRQERLNAAKEKQIELQTQDDGNLPKLGAITYPTQIKNNPQTPTETTSVGDIFAPPPPITPPSPTPYNNGQKPKTPQELAEERRLNGTVFVRENGTANPTAQGGETANNPAGNSFDRRRNTTVANNDSKLGEYLKPTVTADTSAQMLPTLTYLIPKGSKGDCTLETAIDSQLPGMVTCVLAFDIFGANGKVVLLERGTFLTGETKTIVQQGQNRVFVLWSEARTPKGVIAQLDSPATDSLGRSGINGELNTHFWDRFGAAILISVLNGAAQAASSYASGAGNDGGTNINYNPQGANSVMTEVLRNTINIPPTINVRQGERVQILFARDVDFRPVYELGDRYQTLVYQNSIGNK